MISYTVLLSEPAARDLSEIARYIAHELREPAAALRLVKKIRSAVMSLAELPTRHGPVADARLCALGVRMLQVDGYLAFYNVSEGDHTVTVIRILYGRRDWEHIL
ncbi:MAG: type II toxin-antitoxin system RelE/ParE family toxin [Chloroflexota bacterium]